MQKAQDDITPIQPTSQISDQEEITEITDSLEIPSISLPHQGPTPGLDSQFNPLKDYRSADEEQKNLTVVDEVNHEATTTSMPARSIIQFVFFAAQVINPVESDAKVLNKRLDWQIQNSTRGLKFVELDTKSLKLLVFTDA
ncbi:hypothetical protein BP6252_09664 [Coleophoma cylindrospora]|uniref:Uncharacterized protein n=1 Tax=Coleophoma cylindrospora TaxID=1849047 RepID=A0A3D8QW92_9HELO|nr:hypothetical protein BP6252_09664 [Coleophoma cylindrospora]